VIKTKCFVPEVYAPFAAVQGPRRNFSLCRILG